MTGHDYDSGKLVGLIGLGNVAVLEGPLTEPVMLERRGLFDDTSLRWASDLRARRARGLAGSAGPRVSMSLIRSQPQSGCACLSIRIVRLVSSGSLLPFLEPFG